MVKRKYSGPPGGSKAKRTYRKKAVPGIPRVIGNGVLGATRRVKLRYSDTFTISNASGLGHYVYKANSMFDPNHTGSGHQPRGFDEMMAFYDHYTVIGATIKVRFRNDDASGRPYPVISIRDDNTVPGVNIYDFVEYGDKTMSNRPLCRTSGSDSAGHAASTALQLSTDIAKFVGAKNIMDREDLKGSAGADPTELVFFTVNCVDIDARNVNCRCIAEIVYDVVFSEPKNPGSS